MLIRLRSSLSQGTSKIIMKDVADHSIAGSETSATIAWKTKANPLIGRVAKDKNSIKEEMI